MSGELHRVRTIAPGVASVPNPPDPCFQLESLKPGIIHPSGGLDVVYRQITPLFLDPGSTTSTTGGVGIVAHSPGTFCAFEAHFFHVASSASSLMNTPPTTGRA